MKTINSLSALEGAHNLIFIVLIIIGVLANGLLPEMHPLLC